MTNSIPRVLITGATGQVGGKTLTLLKENKSIEIIAAVRSTKKAKPFSDQGIKTVLLDFNDDKTFTAALSGIDRIFIVTGYTFDMLLQSKVLLDSAKKAKVSHIVHLGACGGDDTTVAHWAWHQLVERYIEWSGFSFTHLRPETYMQNLLSYGGKKVINNGMIHQYVEGARLSWVDVDDVAQVAAQALLFPDLHGGKTYRLGYDAKSYYDIAEQNLHGGKTYRLGYDAKSYYDIAEQMTDIIRQPFQYQPQSPEVFLQSMIDAGAEMTYMKCVYDHYKRYAAGTIPGADETFNNFYQITGSQPATWETFIKKHQEEWKY